MVKEVKPIKYPAFYSYHSGREGALYYPVDDLLKSILDSNEIRFNGRLDGIARVAHHLLTTSPCFVDENGGVPQLSPTDAEEWLTEVFRQGATKYGIYSYVHLDTIELVHALVRHINAHGRDPLVPDEDSGAPHLVHVIANCRMIRANLLHNPKNFAKLRDRVLKDLGDTNDQED